MNLDPSRTLVITRHFDTSAERVFDAWLDPAKAGKFLFATASGQMVRAEIDARVGGTFIFTDRRDGQDIEHTGEYLEIDRPRRLVFTFAVPKFSSDKTRVTIDITPAGEGCALKLIHEGVLLDYLGRTRNGWNRILTNLATKIDPNAAYGQVIAPNTLRFTRLLPGPIERVWAYLTESDKRKLWFAGGVAEPRVGGKLELHFNHGNIASDPEPPPEKWKAVAGKSGGPVSNETITRWEPPNVFAWTWDGGEDDASEVIFELTPQGDRVLLVLTHRRAATRFLAEFSGGWHVHLAMLIERLHDREPTVFWAIEEALEEQYLLRIGAK